MKSSRKRTVQKHKKKRELKKCPRCKTEITWYSKKGEKCERSICEEVAKRNEEISAKAKQRRRSVCKKG